MDKDQTQRTFEKIQSFAKQAIDPVKREGPEIAATAVRQVRAIASTKTGSRVLTGAAAGAAIAAALPFVAMTTGALIGAGTLVFWKSAKDAN